MDNELDLLLRRLQMGKGAAVLSDRRTVDHEEMPEMRKPQDSDGMKAWFELQWEILRGAGLLR